MNGLPPQQNSEKNKLFNAFCIFGVIIIILVLIINETAISKWMDSLITILNPVTIGFVLAYFCNPLYNVFMNKFLVKLKKPKLKKALSLFFTYLTVLAGLTLIVVMVIPQVGESYRDLENKFDSYVSSLKNLADEFIQDSPIFNGKYKDLFDFLDANDISVKFEDFLTNSGNVFEKIVNYILAYGKNFILGAKDVFIGLFISIYVLIYKEHISSLLKRLLRALVPRDRYDSLMVRVANSNRVFGDFIIGKLLDSLIIGILTFIILTIFSIPYTPLVSVLVGVTNVIPVFGPFLGAIPSVFIIFIASPSKAIVFIILIIIIQQLDGNLIGPFILGSSTGLTSLGVILSISIMGGFWGIPGMFVGVPLFAVIFEFINEYVNEKLEAEKDPEFPVEKTDAISEIKKAKNSKELLKKVKIFEWVKSLLGKKNK